ncbi:hypothetical protein ACJX0J_014200, partial [Zea mays]
MPYPRTTFFVTFTAISVLTRSIILTIGQIFVFSHDLKFSLLYFLMGSLSEFLVLPLAVIERIIPSLIFQKKSILDDIFQQIRVWDKIDQPVCLMNNITINSAYNSLCLVVIFSDIPVDYLLGTKSVEFSEQSKNAKCLSLFLSISDYRLRTSVFSDIYIAEKWDKA